MSLSPSDFINICLIAGQSYEKLVDRKLAMRILLQLFETVETGVEKNG